MSKRVDELTRRKNSALMLLEFTDCYTSKACGYAEAAVAEIQIVMTDDPPSPPCRGTRLRSALACLERAAEILSCEVP